MNYKIILVAIYDVDFCLFQTERTGKVFAAEVTAEKKVRLYLGTKTGMRLPSLKNRV